MSSCLSDGSCENGSFESFDFNMTEEEAMEIWLRRDNELAAKRRERRCSGSSKSETFSCNSSLGTGSSHREDDLSQGYYSNYQAEPDRNGMPYQSIAPTEEERLADAFVASTPELAQLLDEHRREKARQRAEEERRRLQQTPEHAAQVREYERLRQAHMQRSANSSSERDAIDSFVTSEASSSIKVDKTELGSGGKIESNLATLHPTTKNTELTNCSRCYTYLYVGPLAENFHCPTCEIRTDLKRPGKKEKSDDNYCDAKPHAKEGDNRKSNRAAPIPIDPYYLATPQTTMYNTKPVTCDQCCRQLYTNPLAESFWCQACSKITKIKKKTAESCYEEKMQDMEDFQMEYEVQY